jgi:hypothetical protein
MSTLTITPTYTDGNILYESELDSVKTQIETYYNTTKIQGSNLQAGMIDASDKVAASALNTVKFAATSVSSTNLEDSTGDSDGVTADKIDSLVVVTANIETSTSSTTGVTTAKLADNEITGDRITDNSVPKSIMLSNPAGTVTFTSVSGINSNTIIGSITLTGLTVGKPIILSFEGASTGLSTGFIQVSSGADFILPTVDRRGILAIVKDTSTAVAACYFSGTADVTTYSYETALYRLPPGVFTTVDVATSTSHTYDVYVNVSDPTYNSIEISYIKLNAIQVI